MKYNPQFLTRKIHRYFGFVIGIQFLLWTIGGLYFSWTDIDNIHGDQFKNELTNNSIIYPYQLSNLPDSFMEIKSLELKFVLQTPYFWINNEKLIDPVSWTVKEGISKDEALAVASQHISTAYHVKKIEYLTELRSHHEYRGRPLPAWVIYYKGDQNLKAYVSARDGSFQRVRHNSWRIFDFLWMMHTMDYDSRDNINNWTLRVFSILGLITILSGFLLYFYSSKTFRKS